MGNRMGVGLRFLMGRSDYSARHTKRLVEKYRVFREEKGVFGRGLLRLVELLDVDMAVGQLTPVEYHAVLLCGLLGLPQDEAAKALGVSQSTVSRRYERGLAMLKNLLNGEDDEA